MRRLPPMSAAYTTGVSWASAGRAFLTTERPPDRRLADPELGGQSRHCFALRVALSDHAALLWVELDRASEGDAKLSSALNTGLCSLHDQAALELCQAGKHRQHQLAMVHGGIAPDIGEGAKLCAGPGDDIDRVEQVERRSCKSVKRRHYDRIAWGQGVQETGKLRSIGPHPRHLLGEDLGAASGPESFLLEGKVLLSRRYAGDAVDRHSVALLRAP